MSAPYEECAECFRLREILAGLRGSARIAQANSDPQRDVVDRQVREADQALADHLANPAFHRL